MPGIRLRSEGRFIATIGRKLLGLSQADSPPAAHARSLVQSEVWWLTLDELDAVSGGDAQITKRYTLKPGPCCGSKCPCNCDAPGSGYQ